MVPTTRALAGLIRMDEDAAIARERWVLETMLEWITRYDTKASILLGVDAGMMSVLLALLPGVEAPSMTAKILAVFALVTLGFSAVVTLSANVPRTRGPKDSLIFFNAVADLAPEEYARRVTSENPTQHLADLRTQVRRNAQVVKEKFDALRWSYAATLLAVPAWAAAIALLQWVI